VGESGEAHEEEARVHEAPTNPHLDVLQVYQIGAR